MYDPVTMPPTRDPGPSVVRIGVDVGQRQDYTAIVVTEEEKRADLPHYRARFIERLPLGTAYPSVVARVEEIIRKLETQGKPRLGPRKFSVELLLDATGVGLPVGDMLRERDLEPRLILFTGSDKVTDAPGGVTMLGKAWMISRMQVLLQGQRRHLPRTVEAGALAKELMNYEITINAHANAQFNAKAGAHDDLVIACGLSCGIDRSASKVTSRSYLAPQAETLEDALRDRWEQNRNTKR